MSQMWRGGNKASQYKFLEAKYHAYGKIEYLKHVCKSDDTHGSVKTVEDTGDTTHNSMGYIMWRMLPHPELQRIHMWLYRQ